MATPNKGYALPAKGDKNWHTPLNDNFTAIDGDIDTLDDKAAAFNTEGNLVAAGHNATEPATAAGKISLEVKNARGSLGTLDARLDVGINEDGTLKSDSFSFDQWEDAGISGMAYVSASTFKTTGDATGIFKPGLPVKIDYGTSADRYYHVKGAVYSAGPNETTVTIWDDDPAVLNEAMTQVYTSAYKPNFPVQDAATIVPGSIPVDAMQMMMQGGATVLYYDGSSYSSPFGGNPATSNSGDIGRIEYESGLKIGITYASLHGNISTVEYKISIGGSDTLIKTETYSYDGTTGNITGIARS